MSIRFHLAQVNIGRFRAAIDDPIMDGFRTQLDPAGFELAARMKLPVVAA